MFKPGQKAKVQLKLTDYAGKPFVGSTVIAIYDKSVEYISGGSNVPEIKEFFWKWRRSHNPVTESNLGGYFGNIVPPKALSMNDLGVFGGSVADETLAPRMRARSGDGRSRCGLRQRDWRRQGRHGAETAMARCWTRPRQRRWRAAAPMAPMAGGADGSSGDERACPMLAAGQTRGGPGAAAMVQPTVRTKFADTALWVGQLTTESNGTAEVELNMPENLTTWRIKVWGMGFGTRVGQGQTDVVTRKDLIIRLEAPRFFVQTDEVVLSAIVHNYLKTAKKVEVSLELEGKTLELVPEGDKLRPSRAIPCG